MLPIKKRIAVEQKCVDNNKIPVWLLNNRSKNCCILFIFYTQSEITTQCPIVNNKRGGQSTTTSRQTWWRGWKPHLRRKYQLKSVVNRSRVPDTIFFFAFGKNVSKRGPVCGEMHGHHWVQWSHHVVNEETPLSSTSISWWWLDAAPSNEINYCSDSRRMPLDLLLLTRGNITHRDV